MARITVDNFRKIEKERNSVHDKVDATYTEFICDGQKFFQIDTYGSANRDIKGKVSQSIQIDHEAAMELVELLKKAFDI